MDTDTIWRIRCGIRDYAEAIYRFVREIPKHHPWLKTVYAIWCWLSLLLFIAGLIFFRDSRTMLVQYLWSFYVMLQFWLLCRSKTLTWKRTAAFMLLGVFLVIPVTAWTLMAAHGLFGGRTSDTWSVAVVTPIVEEVWKLLPLALYLLFSRRASSMSLGDYTLAGAAAGVGFQLMEELTRRWLNSGIIGRTYGYSTTMLGGETIHWDFWTLFPGRFEESFFPTLMTVSHPVHTAMVALGLGMAVRARKRMSNAVYALPALLLAWSILDHAAYNGQNDLPDWFMRIHELTGSGYLTKNAFLLMLALGLILDYAALNRVRSKLPAMAGERLIEPLSELLHMATSFFLRRERFVSVIAWTRERREAGFSMLYGNAEAVSVREELLGRMRLHYKLAAGLAALLIGAGLLAGLAAYGQAPALSDGGACFSCMFDSLQDWWDRLSGWEKGAIVLGAFALSLLFVGFWPALGIALTAASIPASGHEIAKNIRDPKRLLTPENAIAALIGLALSRVPFGRLAGKAGDWLKDKLEKLLKPGGKPDPDVPRKPDADGPGDRPDPDERGDKPDPDEEQAPPRDSDDYVHWSKAKYKGVELYDSRNGALGEFDGVDIENGIFYEAKSAEGLNRIHPKTGKPQQTPQQFTDKQLYQKTKTRINNLLEKAVGTRTTPDGTSEIPTLEQIKGIRHFQFQLDGDTPELRAAAENSLNRLRQEFPDYTFTIRFGVK
ncbi:PrsW family glutamic-type intramembrane protease [Paenibacillus arenilitoris]|uniref:PrsW family intramembrane metalloprotease n=1 Tax=Paenibacillus arenilitoris TaxID=2772299 RepID=A0A927CLB1_9BACL|nr:PrsW family glutamic-type intramembrane protease [Paenibacillus arenilitoris]MBD2868897.1 PrsW family intramembrane metalloprotease [Paenibacillus arenilitoris]